ncbi:MAG: glycosyltransferase family 4 protein [Gammaproteobacteria bacterium]|nr:glycosyltransferase family 4 protein [Gammaproteobacteria bacterium]
MTSGARVLALSRYDSMGASSRVRMLQYLPHLERLGLRVQACPLLSNAYVAALYSGRRPDPFDLIRSYAGRLCELLCAARAVVLWVEKELLPWLPFGVERLFHRRGRRLVVDCDDAVWLRYRKDAPAPLRALLRDKMERIFAGADVVAAGNSWIREHARAAGARDARLLPSVVDLDCHTLRAPRPRGNPCRIGWIGSPATVHYLCSLGPVLRRLAAQHAIEVVCVGGGSLRLDGVAVTSRAWNVETEVEAIKDFDIGVMPLADGEWERGKCGYKLIQYMACGVPAVGSRVGANREIVADGEDGLLAGDDAEWYLALHSLITDASLPGRLADAGRRKVERSYSVQARVADLAALLRPAD